MRSVFYGTKGTIICDNTSPSITLFKSSLGGKDEIFGTKNTDAMGIQISLPVAVRDHNTMAELTDFVESILNDTPVPTTSYDGECTVAVCVAAMESAKLGKTVEISYPVK